jgi:two-component system sensor histidine kinase HydH
MDVNFTSAILASVVCLTVAIAILFRRPRLPLYGHFAGFSLALFLWHLSSLTGRAPSDSMSAWQCAAAVLIPPTGIFFFRELLRERTLASARVATVACVLSGGLLLLCTTPWRSTAWLRLPTAAYVFVTLALINRALFMHIQRTRSSTDRKRLSFLLYSGLAALTLAFGELWPHTPWLAALGHIAATAYIYFLYQSIVARRLVDLVEILGKAAVLAALTLLLASIYALLVKWVGEGQQGLWLFNTLVASFVILILYDQVRPWIEETTAKLLFRQRFELRQITRRLQRALRTTLGIDEMRQQVLQAMHKNARISDVAMYLAGDAEMTFYLFGCLGREPPKSLSLAEQPVLLSELRRERRPILQEQLLHRYEELPAAVMRSDPTQQRELERIAEAIETMRAMRASVLIPMVVEDRVVGVLTLGAEHPGESFSTDELASLLSLAEACAVVIENSHEYEKRRERDRLVVVGEMAAGMAHEIRNPLGAIKGAAQCLDPATLPQDAQEFIDVIVEEVDRLNRVVGQFLEYSRPLRGSPMSVDVGEVVTNTLKLLGRDTIPAHVQLNCSLTANLPKVQVDPEHLRQVLINLVLNAVQALPQGGTISLSVGTAVRSLTLAPRKSTKLPAVQDYAESQQVLIRIHDTGAGIAAQDLPRIFLPFFTTKADGTGLGLAISQRIIENAGGRLEVASPPGAGTTFTIKLGTDPLPRRRQTA